MKSLASCCLLVVASTFVGCCSSGNCVSSCDPCARELPSVKCPLKGLFQHRCDKCNPMGPNCGCGPVMGGCATGMCGAVNVPAAPVNCGCGQPHAMHAPAPPVPTMQPPVPLPMPQPAPPTPAAQPLTPPAPPAEFPESGARTLAPQQPVVQAPVYAAPQQVTYEEFQRLPGVVISAPAPQVATPRVPPVTVSAQNPAANGWVPTR